MTTHATISLDSYCRFRHPLASTRHSLASSTGMTTNERGRPSRASGQSSFATYVRGPQTLTVRQFGSNLPPAEGGTELVRRIDPARDVVMAVIFHRLGLQHKIAAFHRHLLRQVVLQLLPKKQPSAKHATQHALHSLCYLPGSCGSPFWGSTRTYSKRCH